MMAVMVIVVAIEKTNTYIHEGDRRCFYFLNSIIISSYLKNYTCDFKKNKNFLGSA